MSYNRAIDSPLGRAGFSVVEKRGQSWMWRRSVGGYVDEVLTSLSRGLDRMDIGLTMRAEDHYAFVRQATGLTLGLWGEFHAELGKMQGGLQGFERRDIEGPGLAAAAIGTHALPFFDRLHSIEGVKAQLLWVETVRWGNSHDRTYYAVLIWFEGDREQALKVLEDPPKGLIEPQRRMVSAVRRLIAETQPPDRLEAQPPLQG
jgi:hypothetical protein